MAPAVPLESQAIMADLQVTPTELALISSYRPGVTLASLGLSKNLPSEGRLPNSSNQPFVSRLGIVPSMLLVPQNSESSP